MITYHFIGLGGIGMSALARILLQQGHRVQGSDRTPSALLEQLHGFQKQMCRGRGSGSIFQPELWIHLDVIPSRGDCLDVPAESGVAIAIAPVATDTLRRGREQRQKAIRSRLKLRPRERQRLAEKVEVAGDLLASLFTMLLTIVPSSMKPTQAARPGH